LEISLTKALENTIQKKEEKEESKLKNLIQDKRKTLLEKDAL